MMAFNLLQYPALASQRRRLHRRGISLVGLVVALLVTLVWLAGRYEASQYQAELESDTVNAVGDIRRSLNNHALTLQSLNAKSLSAKSWRLEVESLMGQHREWLRVERRDLQGAVSEFVTSPYREPLFDGSMRLSEQSEIIQTCVRAKRLNGPAYSRSYFVPQNNGLGFEVIEMCLPTLESGIPVGFVLVTYGLQDILASQLGETYGRRNEISFIESDGTRLAIHGTLPRSRRLFSATQLLDLPGNTLVLRMDGRRGEASSRGAGCRSVNGCITCFTRLALATTQRVASSLPRRRWRSAAIS